MELNDKLESKQNEDDQGPFLSSNVKDIFKRRKEEKNKKGLKKMNLKSLLPAEESEINKENNENEEDNDNEKVQMISPSENLNNEDNMELEKKAKQNYKSIFNLHKNYDINFDTMTNDTNKTKKNSNIKIFCKEIFF